MSKVVALRYVTAVLFWLPTIERVAADDRPVNSSDAKRTLIDVTDIETVRSRQPLLIAHRGGVITPQAPECSLESIRLAAEAGYDMVELDVQETRDGVPLVFHDRTLLRACGLDKRIAELTADEATKIRYLQTRQTIATLAAAMQLCKSLSLGVMLDIKTADVACLQQVARLVRDNGLERSTVTINGRPEVRQYLNDVSLLRLRDLKPLDEQPSEVNPLRGYFWFGHAKGFPFQRARELQAQGALLIPSINVFHYPPEEHLELAGRDIRRLKQAGVDGFQIDSVYQHFLGLPPDAE